MDYWIVLVICVGFVKSERFNCYSCSYTLSGDPTVDYECVTTPDNVTKGLNPVSCQTPYMCSTRASFNQGMRQVRSVTRSCLPQQEICKGDTCCNKAGVYPTCEHKCRAEMCNGLDVEMWLDKSKPGHKSGGTVPKCDLTVLLSLLITCVCCFIMPQM